MDQHGEGCLSVAIALGAKFVTEDRRVNGIVELNEIPKTLRRAELEAGEYVEEDLPVFHDMEAALAWLRKVILICHH